MGVRRRGRELALQMLYQTELSGAGLEQIMASFEELHAAPEGASTFATSLVQGVLAHLGELDAHIASHADNWRLERMAAVDRNVLRLALYELVHEPDTPPAVVIDEAVELAKRFGSEQSGKFVNGILDGFAHRTRASGAS